jgi:alpha-beta hydrolase superfamily lysophospholipase
MKKLTAVIGTGLAVLSISTAQAGNHFYNSNKSLTSNAEAIAKACSKDSLSSKRKSLCFNTAKKAYSVYKKEVLRSDRDFLDAYLQDEYAEKVLVSIHSYTMEPEHAQDAPRYYYEKGNSGLFVGLTGHMNSNVPFKDIHGKEWIADTRLVVQIAQGFGDKVVTSGFSLGGLLAIYAAKENPSLVDGYLAMAPSFSGGTSLPLSSAACLARSGFVRGATKKLTGHDLNHDFILGGCAIFRVSKKIARNAQNHNFTKGGKKTEEYYQQTSRARRDMRKLTMPGVIIHSQKDTIVNPHVTATLSWVLKKQVAKSNFVSVYYQNGEGKNHFGDHVYFDSDLEFNGFDALDFIDKKLK